MNMIDSFSLLFAVFKSFKLVPARSEFMDLKTSHTEFSFFHSVPGTEKKGIQWKHCFLFAVRCARQMLKPERDGKS